MELHLGEVLAGKCLCAVREMVTTSLNIAMNAARAVTVKSMILFIHVSSSKSEKSEK